MNWKRIFLYVGAGALAGPLGHFASEAQAGHHIAFTVGNILWPALGTGIVTLAALFARPPQHG